MVKLFHNITYVTSGLPTNVAKIARVKMMNNIDACILKCVALLIHQSVIECHAFIFDGLFLLRKDPIQPFVFVSLLEAIHIYVQNESFFKRHLVCIVVK